MNKTILMTASLVVAVLAVQGQVVPDASAGASALSSQVRPLVNALSIVERGPNHNLFELVQAQTNELGEVLYTTNQYTQLEGGLNHRVKDKWVPSSREIVITDDGAVGTNSQHQVFFSGEINMDGAVEIVTPQGQHLKTRVIGLSYFDQTSKQSTLIADLQDTQGQVLPSKTQVLYRNCLRGDGVRASLRYDFTLEGLEQNVVIEGQLPSPSDWGMDPATTVLQVLTEFIDAPQPTIRSRSKDGMTDEALDFGSMAMGDGKAFTIGNESDSVDVKKQWLNLDGRTVLVEELKFESVEPQLQALPAVPADDNQGAFTPIRSRVNPRTAFPPRQHAKKSSNKMRMASLNTSQKGFLIDYFIRNTSATNFTFVGGSTYYLTGPVTLSGITTFESAIIKAAATNSPSITINGSVNCLSSPYWPLVITGFDDKSVGENITGGSGNPANYYATTALNFTSTNTVTLQNVRIAYAQNALALNGSSSNVLSHIQLVNCQYGIAATNSTFSLRNALFWNVLTNFVGSGSVGSVEHLTADTASRLNGGLSLALTNSLLVAVTNAGSFTSNKVYSVTGTNGIFRSVGAGSHYLADGSPYIGIGSTNINPNLLASLRNMTVYPPIVLPASISVDTTLSPQAQRDSGIPSIGYHYDPIDYFASNTVCNNTLILTNGVALGVMGSSYGLYFYSKNIYSTGTPFALNRLVHFANVQENAFNLGGSPFIKLGSSGSTFRFAFTDAAVRQQFVAFDSYGSTSELSFRNSQLRGCTIDLAAVASSFLLNNNLLERVTINTTDYNKSPGTTLYNNNLFRGGSTYFYLYNSFYAQDNLFDLNSCSYYGAGGSFYVSFSNNGFTTNTANSLGGSNNKVNLIADYQTGPLGRYYYPTNGNATSLTNLVDKGSCLATARGLYHFATQISQVKETNSYVDIGYHYVAVDSTKNPVDTDGDGVPDYLEDANGDGNPANDLTSWQSYNSPNGLSGASPMDVFTPMRP